MLLDPDPDRLKKILDLIESYLDPVCKILTLAFSICSDGKSAFCPILHEQCLVSEVTSDSLSSITKNRMIRVILRMTLRTSYVEIQIQMKYNLYCGLIMLVRFRYFNTDEYLCRFLLF